MNSIIYKEEILEHYKDPQNFGKLKEFSHVSKLTNPLCGDDIEMYLKIENSKVKEISFDGKGCAITIAAASLLTEKVKDMTPTQLKQIEEDDVLALLGIPISQTRKKCAFLPLVALKDSLDSKINDD